MIKAINKFKVHNNYLLTCGGDKIANKINIENGFDIEASITLEYVFF